MYIVCITSCSVGIVHTYMTATNLEKVVKAKGYEVRAEAQGVQGAENEITAEGIGCVDGCTIASDTRVKSPGGFEPVPTLMVGVSEAAKDIKATVEELLEVTS